jgi:hypothetical protein
MSQPPNTMSSRLPGQELLIFGARPSVLAETNRAHLRERADRLGQTLRMAITSAMVVVLTAPRPTRRRPLPFFAEVDC